MRQRTQEVRRAIGAMDYVASGNLYVRMKACGRPNCRCATDPEARHGPYYEWTHREEGRFLHRVMSPKQGEVFARAIENYREIRRLLARWERETAKEILDPDEADGS